jgi:hypothetical protein
MNQAPPPMQPYRSSGEQALDRVKTELGAAKLSDPRLIADLRCTSATRMTYVAGTVIHTAVARQATLVDEPLATPPAAPSMRVDKWHPEWPPQSSRDLVNRVIDVREAYEVLACPRCNAAGRTPCGVCLGSGQVAHAKTRRPTTCSGCRGQGTVPCGQCRGHCRLLRFLRIIQTVTTPKQTVMQPKDSLGVPRGVPSGSLSVEKPLGFSSADAAEAAIIQSSPALAGERIHEIAMMTANQRPNDDASQTGWVGLQGKWFDGWELQCTTGGIPKRYFVPDTAAGVVGSRLYSKTKLGSALGAVVAIVALAIGTLQFTAERQRGLEEAARSAEVARETAEHAAHLTALRGEVPHATQEVDTALRGVDTMETTADATALKERLTVMKNGLARFDELQPKPPEVAVAAQKLDAAIRTLGELADTVEALNLAVQSTKDADALVAKRAWVEGDDLYATAITKWAVHPGLMTALKLPNEKGDMAAVDPAAQTARVVAKRRRIAGSVAAARAGLAAEEKRQEALAAAERKEQQAAEAVDAVRGTKPVNSGWDGSIYCVESYLKRALNDPDSYQHVSTTVPVAVGPYWVVDSIFRAKNGFGALTAHKATFKIQQEQVVDMQEE